MYFEYGEAELAYLRQKDERLCEVIDCAGHIGAVDTNLFSSVVRHIIRQQISTKAQAATWRQCGFKSPRPRMRRMLNLSSVKDGFSYNLSNI